MSTYTNPPAMSDILPPLPSAPSLDSLYRDLDLYINEIDTPSIPKDASSKEPSLIATDESPSSAAADEGRLRLSISVPSMSQAGMETPDMSPPASPSWFPRVPETPAQTPPEKPTPTESRVPSGAAMQPPRELPRPAPPVPPAPMAPNVSIYKPRTSSLDRQSTSQTRVISTRSSSIKNNPHHHSRPSASRFNTQRIQEEDEEELDETMGLKKGKQSGAILSELAREFITQVDMLNASRKIFCTEEYPKSFTGQEAVLILRDLLPPRLQQSIYRKVARALLRTDPPLIRPISYAEKSLRKNTLYDSPNETYTLVQETLDKGPAKGVYTPLAVCYSYACRMGEDGCYAISCPYKNSHAKLSKMDKLGQSGKMSVASSSIASSHDTTLSRAWQATVPREILQSIPEQEIKRQEAIHELIYTEEDYRRDLRLLDEVFAKALRTAQCIEIERRDAFCDQIFHNYTEVLAIHNDLYADLRDRQNACQAKSVGGCVDQIGDIFLRHVHKFMRAYTNYGPHVALSDYISKREMNQNMLYHNFIREKEKQAECRKLPFRHFLLLPVTRLQRYPLLLDAVLKRTQEDHPDKDDIAECVDIIRNVSQKMDELMENTKKIQRLWTINDSIRFKPNKVYELDLLAPGRRLVHEGTFRRRLHIGEWIDIHAFLFDHMLVLTKPKTVGGVVEYHISKRPIPLELLCLGDASEAVSLSMRTMTSTQTSTFMATSPAAAIPPQAISGNQALLTLRHLGRFGGEHHLYAENGQMRAEWKEKILKAKSDLEVAHPERIVFEARSLSDTTFSLTSGPANHGRVMCSTAFVGARGIRMIAIGTEMGVWIGIEGDTNNLSRVLKMDDVTQIGVLEEHHIFLILADKTVYAYPLDSLDPTAPNPPKEPIYQRLAGNVSFFNTGVCNNRTLVLVMKKKGVNSIFKAYEPICGDLRDPRNAKFLASKASFLRQPPAWFKMYKEFYVGATATSIQFLKARLAVVCERGFEIIDLNHLQENHNLPNLRDPSFAFVPPQCNPLGMFRVHDKYLLCYDTFAFTVDMRGKLMPGYPRIDWEGTPVAVAFSYPYVIAFDPQFLEVRHAETGALVQVLSGNNMRCLQYKQNAITPPVIHGCMSHPFKPEYQYIFHLVGNFELPAW